MTFTPLETSMIRSLFALLLALAPTALFAQTVSDVQLSGLSKTTDLTADNQAVSAAGFGMIFLTSDNATAANRTMTLTASALVGHRVVLVWNDTDQGEMADTGIQKLSATWSPGQYDTLTLVSDGTNWIEVSRTDN